MSYLFTSALSQYALMTLPSMIAPLTIAAWFRTPSFTGVSQNIVAVSNLANFHRYTLTLDASSGISTFTNGTGASFNAITTVKATANTWVHGCSVFPAGNTVRTAYINGANPVSATGTAVPSGVLNQGSLAARYNGSWGAFFNGDVADVGVWSTALSDSEIESLSKGVSASLVRPQSLVFCAPLIRNLVDICGGAEITNVNGATVSVHPRLYA